MECSQPGIIQDEELLAFLAGEPVRPVVQQHLAQCLRCSTRIAEYRELEHSLIQKFYRWDCPSNQILGEFQLGYGPESLAFDGANIWATAGYNVVVKLRPSDGANVGTFSTGNAPEYLVFDGAHIWVSNRDSNTVTKF